MDAELGATTSVFPFNARMAEYLAATERTVIAAAAAKYKDNILSPDAGLKYDQVRFKLHLVFNNNASSTSSFTSSKA